MTRDRYDVMSSDVVLFNLLGTTTVSIGTCIEFGWADAFRKPVVLVMEPEGNLHDHPMVREAAGYIVPTLDEAVQVLDCILNPQLEENHRG
jgi:nucleoside 2-deoxyribosyltransferase